MRATWETNVQYLAQVGHFLGGYGAILTTASFSAVLGGGWEPVWIAFAIGVAVAAFKEFYLDVRPPENDSWANSAMDFGFYLGGGGVSLGVTWLLMHYAGTHCA